MPTRKLMNILGELAHNLQIERGLTALFIDSEREIFPDELREHYGKSEKDVSDLQIWLAEYQNYSTETWYKKLSLIPGNMENLNLHRQKVQDFEIEFVTAINSYTYKYIYPVLDINVEIALGLEDVKPAKVSAYSNFLHWKERLGRERAWGAHGFCSNVFKNREFTQRLLSLIEEQSAYKRSFLSLASKRQIKDLEAGLGGYMMEVLDEIHKKIKMGDDADDLQALSPITWFELLTGKIERMRKVEISLVESLAPDEPKNISNALSSPIKNNLETHMPIIKALPIFSKMSDVELSGLLQHAELREYEKGKLLFMQDETLSRYYLILQGWVKLYKSSEAGEEAVLQMLSSGDSLMEASVFLNIPSMVNAQVVQKVRLLSIPAPIIRQSIINNKKLALNMIGGLSMRSQGLIRQLEQSRLKTATERVGWFLLKQGIEQSGGKANVITLPYDKSTIASYLDMTPETFSRTLKKFKNKGFQIQNDQITKPDPKALCYFCDEDLSTACIYKDNKSCPQTYMS